MSPRFDLNQAVHFFDDDEVGTIRALEYREQGSFAGYWYLIDFADMPTDWQGYWYPEHAILPETNCEEHLEDKLQDGLEEQTTNDLED